MMKSRVGFLILLLVFCLRTEAETNKTKDFSYLLKLADLDTNRSSLRSFSDDYVKEEFDIYTSRKRIRPIPWKFDLRDHPNCGKVISKIRNQGSCGSHWAVAITSVMSDRYCLAHPKHPFVEFSTEDILFCCRGCSPRRFRKSRDSCKDSARIMEAMLYLYNEGVVTGSHFSNKGCKPYSNLTASGKSSECALYCTNPDFDPSRSYSQDKVFAKEVIGAYKAPGLTIQVELLNNGPVFVTFDYVPKDFIQKYKKGIYKPLGRRESLKQHVARVIGWGEEAGNPYWLLANSWGEEWGEKGFFKLERGAPDSYIGTWAGGFTLNIENESYPRTVDVKASVLPMVWPMVWSIYVIFALILLYF